MKLKDVFTYFEKNDSVSLLLIPFFVLIFLDEGHLFELICFYSLVIIVEIINSRIKRIFRFIIYIISIIIFYTISIYNDTQDIIHSGRTILFFLIGFSLIITPLISYIFIYKKFKQLNFFLVLFSFLIITSNYFFTFNNVDEFLDEIEFNFKKKDLEIQKKSNPVILIVLDELISYNHLFGLTKDSLKSFKFSNDLEKIGYITRKEFISQTENTIYSIPSIFNFNLFNNSKGMDSIQKMGRVVKSNQLKFTHLIKNNKLSEKLKKRGIKVNSYGVTEFNRNSKFDHVWGIENSLPFSFKTTFFLILSKTLLNKLQILGTYPRFHKQDNFNKQVYDSLQKTVFKNNNFYYFHFLAPHEPFIWGKEYKITWWRENPKNYLNLYIDYLSFIENKIFKVLKSDRFKNSRVIITGDHGFRSNKTNGYKTSLFLKGFDQKILMKEFTVQDLGFLIDQSFK